MDSDTDKVQWGVQHQQNVYLPQPLCFSEKIAVIFKFVTILTDITSMERISSFRIRNTDIVLDYYIFNEQKGAFKYAHDDKKQEFKFVIEYKS